MIHGFMIILGSLEISWCIGRTMAHTSVHASPKVPFTMKYIWPNKIAPFFLISSYISHISFLHAVFNVKLPLYCALHTYRKARIKGSPQKEIQAVS